MVAAEFDGTVGVPGLADIVRMDRVVSIAVGHMNKAEQYLAVGVDNLQIAWVQLADVTA